MTLSGGPLLEERLLTIRTLIMMSLLKAWKVTVVGIECDVTSISRRPGRPW